MDEEHHMQKEFEKFLEDNHPPQHRRLLKYRSSEDYNPELAISVACSLDLFLKQKFDLQSQTNAQNSHFSKYDDLVWTRRYFVNRSACRTYPTPDPEWENSYTFTTEEKFINDAKANFEDENLLKYASFAALHPKGIEKHKGTRIFIKTPKIDPDELVNPNPEPKKREGFAFEGGVMHSADASWHLNYCLYCHMRKKDSCRTGLPEKDGIQTEKGCPLDQKVSEMIWLKRYEYSIGSLAMIMLDNPFAVLTGQRICNDCSKSCIYQKQPPVDIPRLETRIVKDVLDLKIGKEIYKLLLKWNPLIIPSKNPLWKSCKQNICIFGLGPAGIAMAYYMILRGHKVYAFDANLRLTKNGLQNFGGVMDYGITARWDKEFLNIAYESLIDFGGKNLEIIAGVRFGDSFNITDIKAKFGKETSVILAIGSGKPKAPETLTQLANSKKGVIMGSDFLMNLHLKKPYLNPQKGVGISGPVCVIGLGLTAIDCATEAKKLLEIAGEIGDVKIIYRSRMQNSKAYRENHEEVQNALAEGVKIVENFKIKEFEFTTDFVSSIIGECGTKIDAKTVILATGLDYNTNPLEEIGVNASEVHHLQNGFKTSNGLYLIGDLNPKYHGSVVKALASAKDCAHHIPEIECNPTATANIFKSFVVKVERTQNIWKVVVNSPFIAEKFDPGDVVRISFDGFNFTSTICYKNGTNLTFILETEAEIYTGMELTIMNQIRHMKDVGGIKSVKYSGVKQGYIARLLAEYYHCEAVEISGEKALEIEYSGGTVSQSQIRTQCLMNGVCGRCMKIEKEKITFQCGKLWSKL